MSLVNRKVTYRMYPTSAQEQRLLEMHQWHQQLYNDALYQRIFGISLERAACGAGDPDPALKHETLSMPAWQAGWT